MLDDRALKDIGLSRCQVPWIREEMVWYTSDFDDVSTKRGPAASDVAGDDEKTDVRGQPAQTPALVAAVTASGIEMPANDDRMRKAS